MAVVSRKSLGLSNLAKLKYSSFEVMDCQLDTQPNVCIVLIYRPPGATFDAFMEEFEELLEKLSGVGGELLILGDFNVHYEDPNCHQSSMLKDLCSSFDFYSMCTVRLISMDTPWTCSLQKVTAHWVSISLCKICASLIIVLFSVICLSQCMKVMKVSQ